nr:GGDEF domain-containing protein [Pseudoalteromonas luteoviolacea]
MTITVVNLLLRHIDSLHELLKEESSKDALTGALNRRQLNLFLKDALANKLHYHSDSTLIMIDVDHFKKINDLYGHAKGDEVLISLASGINTQIRETDLLFRVGGEEFVILLPNTTLETAEKVAEKLRATIRTSTLIEDHPVTVSLGICATDNRLTQTKWMSCADKALYAAKQRGRDRACLYNLNCDKIEDVAA